MFDLPPSSLAYVLIMPAYLVALVSWFVWGRSRRAAGFLYRPYALGLLLAVVGFPLSNLVAGLLADLASQYFGPSPLPPSGAPEHWQPASNYTLEALLALFYLATNVVAFGLAVSLPFRTTPRPNHALQRASTWRPSFSARLSSRRR